MSVSLEETPISRGSSGSRVGDVNTEEAEEAGMVDEVGLKTSSNDEGKDEQKVELMEELATTSDEGGNKHATNTSLF